MASAYRGSHRSSVVNASVPNEKGNAESRLIDANPSRAAASMAARPSS